MDLTINRKFDLKDVFLFPADKMGPKKKNKVARGEKEKPLLTVQGVLRLDKSFVTAQHDDAGEMIINRGDKVGQEVIQFVPGASEHDLVNYKAGYEVGPANPFPTNEPEKLFFEEQRKVEEINERFEELKKKSEEEKRQRMEKFKRENGAAAAIHAPVNPEDLDPDNPKNYFLPESLKSSGSGGPSRAFAGPSTSSYVAPPGEEDSSSLTSFKDQVMKTQLHGLSYHSIDHQSFSGNRRMVLLLLE